MDRKSVYDCIVKLMLPDAVPRQFMKKSDAWVQWDRIHVTQKSEVTRKNLEKITLTFQNKQKKYI